MNPRNASGASHRRPHRRKRKSTVHPLAVLILAVGVMVLLPLALGAKASAQLEERIEWQIAGDSSQMDTGVSDTLAPPDAPVAPAIPDASSTPTTPAAPDDGTKNLTQGGGAADGEHVAAEEQADSSASQELAPQGGVSAHGWNLVLVNPWNALKDADPITLVTLKNGQSVDERCYPDLQAMMDDCHAAGLSPLICSSYRTQEKQQKLFYDKLNSLIAQGYSEENAKTEAGKIVAVPGTSEHQSGLALDIVDLNHQNLDKTQESTAVQKWLMDNSWKYGFILRYPDGKSDITGIIYEPWHYRYVGKDAAKQIYEQGVCLEEYLAQSQA